MLKHNLRPLALIALSAYVGFFLGNFVTGLIVGITIVAFATLFF